MPDPANTHSDGVLVWETQTVTVQAEGVSTGGVTYILEEGSLKQGTTIIEQKNAAGVVTDDVMIETPYTGSCTLQLGSLTKAVPAIASHFTIVPIGGGTPLAVKVSENNSTWSTGAATKCSVEVRQKFH